MNATAAPSVETWQVSNLHPFLTLCPQKVVTTESFNFFSKLLPTVYPSNMAPIGMKLWQHAFQSIYKIWFFDAKQKNVFLLPRKIASNQNSSISELWILERHWQTTRRKSFVCFLSTIRGKGVNNSVCVFDPDLAPKLTSIMCFGWYDHKISWRYDHMTLW